MDYTDYDLQANVIQKLETISANSVKGLSLLVSEWKDKILSHSLVEIVPDDFAEEFSVTPKILIDLITGEIDSFKEYTVESFDSGKIKVLDSLNNEHEIKISYNFGELRDQVITIPGYGFTTMEWITISWFSSALQDINGKTPAIEDILIPIWKNIEDITVPESVVLADGDDSEIIQLPINNAVPNYGSFITREASFSIPQVSEGYSDDEGFRPDKTIDLDMHDWIDIKNRSLEDALKANDIWTEFINIDTDVNWFWYVDIVDTSNTYGDHYAVFRKEYHSIHHHILRPDVQTDEGEAMMSILSIEILADAFKQAITPIDMLRTSIEQVNNLDFHFLDNFGYYNLAKSISSVLRDPVSSGSSKIKRLLGIFFNHEEDLGFFTDPATTYYGINPLWNTINSVWSNISTGLGTATAFLFQKGLELVDWFVTTVPSKIVDVGSKLLSKLTSPITLNREVITLNHDSVDKTFFWSSTEKVIASGDLLDLIVTNDMVGRTICLSLISSLIVFNFEQDEGGSIYSVINTFLRPTLIDFTPPLSTGNRAMSEILSVPFNSNPGMTLFPYRDARFNVVNDDSLWDDGTFWYTMYAAAISSLVQLDNAGLHIGYVFKQKERVSQSRDWYFSYAPIIAWPRSMHVDVEFEEHPNDVIKKVTLGDSLTNNFKVYGYSNPSNLDFKNAIHNSCSNFLDRASSIPEYDATELTDSLQSFSLFVLKDFLSEDFTPLVTFELNREISHGVYVKSDLENKEGIINYGKVLLVSIAAIILTVTYFKVRSSVRMNQISLEAQKQSLFRNAKFDESGKMVATDLKSIRKVNRRIKKNNKLSSMLFLPTQNGATQAIKSYSSSGEADDGLIYFEEVKSILK